MYVKVRIVRPSRSVPGADVAYPQEDLIIPHVGPSTSLRIPLVAHGHLHPQHYTFYDFIVNKARGKSGPLFNFDVHDDVRLLADASVEKDESHAGKVVERSWYQRNKHIFPASRWEVRHCAVPDPDQCTGTYAMIVLAGVRSGEGVREVHDRVNVGGSS